MGICVLVMGKSGSGKSASMMNFKGNELAILNVAGKPLPFRGNFPMMVTTSDIDKIIATVKNNSVNCYAIDDSQYLMAFKLMNKITESGYTKYTEIAVDFKKLVDAVAKCTSPDTIVYFLHHVEQMDDGTFKAKTTGKMIDNWLTLEGLFSIVIMCVSSEGKHYFVTQSDGTNTCKSPIGMLEETMPNDLKAVDTAIREYYGLSPIGSKPAKKENGDVKVTTSKKVGE